MQTHVVTRSFVGLGRTVERHEVVDATSWPTLQALENQKYLKEAHGVTAHPCACGRQWASKEALESHGCANEPVIAGKSGQSKKGA